MKQQKILFAIIKISFRRVLALLGIALFFTSSTLLAWSSGDVEYYMGIGVGISYAKPDVNADSRNKDQQENALIVTAGARINDYIAAETSYSILKAEVEDINTKAVKDIKYKQLVGGLLYYPNGKEQMEETGLFPFIGLGARKTYTNDNANVIDKMDNYISAGADVEYSGAIFRFSHIKYSEDARATYITLIHNW